MRHLTNTDKHDADKVIQQLCVGWRDRVIVPGEPKATEAAPADHLADMGVIGLYEIAPGVAVS